jgi:hypothetical protein
MQRSALNPRNRGFRRPFGRKGGRPLERVLAPVDAPPGDGRGALSRSARRRPQGTPVRPRWQTRGRCAAAREVLAVVLSRHSCPTGSAAVCWSQSSCRSCSRGGRAAQRGRVLRGLRAVGRARRHRTQRAGACAAVMMGSAALSSSGYFWYGRDEVEGADAEQKHPFLRDKPAVVLVEETPR